CDEVSVFGDDDNFREPIIVEICDSRGHTSFQYAGSCDESLSYPVGSVHDDDAVSFQFVGNHFGHAIIVYITGNQHRVGSDIYIAFPFFKGTEIVAVRAYFTVVFTRVKIMLRKTGFNATTNWIKAVYQAITVVVNPIVANFCGR